MSMNAHFKDNSNHNVPRVNILMHLGLKVFRKSKIERYFILILFSENLEWCRFHKYYFFPFFGYSIFFSKKNHFTDIYIERKS